MAVRCVGTGETSVAVQMHPQQLSQVHIYDFVFVTKLVQIAPAQEHLINVH